MDWAMHLHGGAGHGFALAPSLGPPSRLHAAADRRSTVAGATVAALETQSWRAADWADSPFTAHIRWHPTASTAFSALPRAFSKDLDCESLRALTDTGRAAFGQVSMLALFREIFPGVRQTFVAKNAAGTDIPG